MVPWASDTSEAEPIWPQRTPDEVVECGRHEALLNLALPPTTPLWLMCPYDITALPRAVIDEAEAAGGQILQHRFQRPGLAHQLGAHEVHGPDESRKPAHRPGGPVEVLAGAGRGQERLRTGIAVGIVERLHRQLEQDLVAGLAGPAGLRVVDRGQDALDLAAHGLHGAGGDDALRGAADAHHEVDGVGGGGLSGRDGAGDVAVGDEADLGSGLADVADQVGVAGAVEDHDDDLVGVDALGLGQCAVQLGTGGSAGPHADREGIAGIMRSLNPPRQR